MGVSQHFLDPRTFTDTMTLLFQSKRTQQAQKSTLWFVQYLLVMAMGKLMDFDTQSTKPFPGAAYFAEAMQLLPPLHQLGSHGVIAVEILCLVATYLQWCNRKHDAYVYVSECACCVLGLRCKNCRLLAHAHIYLLRSAPRSASLSQTGVHCPMGSKIVSRPRNPIESECGGLPSCWIGKSSAAVCLIPTDKQM